MAGRPFATVEELDAASFVGPAALERLADYAELSGTTACEVRGDREQGIISDLDKTVIPPEDNLALPDAPYPGVTRLYQILEFGQAGTMQAGDMNFVTARNPERVVDIPDWLELQDIPTGPIHTGLTGVPWLAQAEKVRDITEVLSLIHI